MHKYAVGFAEMLLENIVAQTSSSHNLARFPKRLLERFLYALANLHLDNASIDLLRWKFDEFLPDFPLDSELAQLMLKDGPPNPPVVSHTVGGETSLVGTLFSPQAIAAINQRRLVVSLSTVIKQAWTAPDAETRDWKMFILRRQILSFYYAEDQWPASPPPFTPLQQALRYLQMEGHRARRCANAECSAPYFLAKRRNQKFCGDDCAMPSRLEAKRRWWDQNNPREKKKGKDGSSKKR
jgi:hypothetical protein